MKKYHILFKKNNYTPYKRHDIRFNAEFLMPVPTMSENKSIFLYLRIKKKHFLVRETNNTSYGIQIITSNTCWKK